MPRTAPSPRRARPQSAAEPVNNDRHEKADHVDPGAKAVFSIQAQSAGPGRPVF